MANTPELRDISKDVRFFPIFKTDGDGDGYKDEHESFYMRGIELYKSTKDDPSSDLFLTSNKPSADITLTERPFLSITGTPITFEGAPGGDPGLTGFNKYTIDGGVNYQDSYPVIVINSGSYKKYLGSLGKCLVVTGGCKLDINNPFFSPVSHKVMFLAGYEVGLQWVKTYKTQGFDNVCTGSMIQDNTLPGTETSKSFDFLFPYGFALGLKHAKILNGEKEEDEEEKDMTEEAMTEEAMTKVAMTEEEMEAIKANMKKEIEEHLNDMVTPLTQEDMATPPTPDKRRPRWIEFANQDLPVINIKDMYKCYQDANPQEPGDLTDGKLTLLQDFWYSPFGKTVVFHPGVEGGKIKETTNSIKEYLLALCLQNKGGGRVIAASGGPTVTQNIILYTCQEQNVYTYSIAGSNPHDKAKTGAIPPSIENRTTEDSFNFLLTGRLNDGSEGGEVGELYTEISKFLGPKEAETARNKVVATQKGREKVVAEAEAEAEAEAAATAATEEEAATEATAAAQAEAAATNNLAKRLNYLTVNDKLELELITQLEFDGNKNGLYNWNGFPDGTDLSILRKYAEQCNITIQGRVLEGGSRKKRTRKNKKGGKRSRKNNRRVNVSGNKTKKRKRVRTRRINQSNA